MAVRVLMLSYTIVHHGPPPRYLLNGADDVVKYEKWWHVKDYEDGERYITVGRPGYVPGVLQGDELSVVFIIIM